VALELAEGRSEEAVVEASDGGVVGLLSIANESLEKADIIQTNF